MQPLMHPWIRSVVYASLSIVAAFLLPRLEEQYFMRAHAMSIASAQAFLSAIASGMIALTAIVFSLAFVILQFAGASYSPRLAPLLARDPVLFDAFSIFVATFAYALGTLASIDRNRSGIVPMYSIGIVVTLLGLSMIFLGLLIQRLGRLQIYHVLRYIGNEGRHAIAALPLLREDEDEPAEPSRALAPSIQIVNYSSSPHYVTHIDADALVEIAAKAGGTIAVSCAVGDCVGEGAVLAYAHGVAGELPAADVLRAFRFSSERNLRTDPKYAFRLLVDTAIRALSPAVNDPTTAVQSLDEIEDLLCRLARRKLAPSFRIDAQGTTRLIMAVPRWGDYVHLAFDEICLCGTAQLQVLRRLHAAILSVSAAAATESRRREVSAYVRRIEAAIVRAGFDEIDSAEALRPDRQGLGVTFRPA